MAILAVDWGEKRIGLAISFEGYFARPYGSLRRTRDEEVIEKIQEICSLEQVKKIVVGFPKTLEGEVGRQAEKTKEFAHRLEFNLKHIPVEMVDEALTTYEAKENLKAEGKNPEEIKKAVDAEAARIILQDYLNLHSK